MTPKQAYDIASQWGSYVHDGDPGAVFYTFPGGDGRPQNEGHRKLLLAYCDSLITALTDEKNAEKRDTDNALDLQQLRELRAFFEAWPLDLDDFALAYVTCALWSSSDNADDSGGSPLDSNYSVQDIAPETMAKMLADCSAFENQTAGIRTAMELAGLAWDASQAGHDFWLTRNHHGAGFWDRGLGEYGNQLTKVAHNFGGCDLSVGDDKKIYAD